MVTSGQLLNPLLETSEESAPNWNPYFGFSLVSRIFYGVSFHYQIPTKLEFSSHFTGLPCPLSVLLNAFTFAQSTHAPLTPLSHSPADDREVEEVEEEGEEEEEEEEEEKQGGQR